MKKFFNEFKDFISRGNVIDLAVAVVMGASFNQLITSVVTNFIDPIIGALTTGNSLSDLSFNLFGVVISYGQVVSTAINFFITALFLFAIIKAMNSLEKMLIEKEEAKEDKGAETTEALLKDIRTMLKELLTR